MFKKLLAFGVIIGSVYASDSTQLEGLPGLLGQWPASIKDGFIEFSALKTSISMTANRLSEIFPTLDPKKIKVFFERSDIKGLAEYIKNQQSETSPETEADS